MPRLTRSSRLLCLLLIPLLIPQAGVSAGQAASEILPLRDTLVGAKHPAQGSSLQTQNQGPDGSPLQSLLQNAGSPQPSTPSGPVVARLSFDDQAELNRLAQTLDIWEVDHARGTLLALLAPAEWERLAGAGYRLEVDSEKTRRLDAPRLALPGQTAGIQDFPCYRTVEETYAGMAALAAHFPGLAEVIDIGDSWDKITPGGPAGYDLFALRITHESRPGPKPAFFLMAAIHAREYSTAELAMRFGEWLVENYGIDADATWLLDYYEVHIVPQSNPDGRKIAEAGQLWRKNTDSDDGCLSTSNYGVDLNRNHSFQWGGAGDWACDATYQGTAPASEPEIQALQAYVASLFPDQRGPGLSDPAPEEAAGVFLTLHSYWPLVLFPWGWTEAPAPNGQALETLGRKFGFFNGYAVCQSGEPGCIYATTGTSDDWAYGELGLAAYTFELGHEFFEDCRPFEETLLPGNLPALLYAFKAARRPYLDPAGPESLYVELSPASLAPGETYTITAQADDTRFDSHGWGAEPVQLIASARYSLDTPSWIPGTPLHPLEAADGAFDGSIEGLAETAALACLLPGQHTLFVESQDSAGHWGVPGAAFLQVEPGRAFSVDQEDGRGYALPGQVITYTLQVSNQGNLPDPLTVALDSHWPATTASTVSLPPCASTLLPVTVTIPSEALPGQSDWLTLTFTSQAEPTRMVTVKLAAFVPQASLFMPMIH